MWCVEKNEVCIRIYWKKPFQTITCQISVRESGESCCAQDKFLGKKETFLEFFCPFEEFGQSANILPPSSISRKFAAVCLAQSRRWQAEETTVKLSIRECFFTGKSILHLNFFLQFFLEQMAYSRVNFWQKSTADSVISNCFFLGKCRTLRTGRDRLSGIVLRFRKGFFFSHARTLSRIIHPFYVRARKLAIKKSPPICQTHVRENVFEKKSRLTLVPSRNRKWLGAKKKKDPPLQMLSQITRKKIKEENRKNIRES